MRFLHRAQAGFEVFLRQADHHARIHLHETAIGIPRESLVACVRLREALHRLVVQAEVQNRLHHAGHRARGTGTHAHQQRGFARSPSFFLVSFLELGDVSSTYLRAAPAGYFLPCL